MYRLIYILIKGGQGYMISNYNFKIPAYLHNHSNYSFLDGVPSLKEWHNWAIENNVPGFSVTDHGSAISLNEIIQFDKFTEEYNKKNQTNLNGPVGVPGIEFYVKLNKKDKKHFHINLWAISDQGYRNLIKLSSMSFTDTVKYFGNTKPRVTIDEIKENMEGIVVGTACIASPMGSAVMNEDLEKAKEMYKLYIDTFGKDKLYVEFHSSDLKYEYDRKTRTHEPIKKTDTYPDGNCNKAYNLFLWRMVKKYGGKPIPATDAHFIDKEDKAIQDCLLKNSNPNGWTFYESYHQKTVDEMYLKLREHLGDRLTPEVFSNWIDNTLEISNQAKNINITYSYRLPKVEIPEHIKKQTDDYDKQTFLLLIEKIKEHGRWNLDKEYIERFKKEIDVIKDNKVINLIPYFLLYEDLCKYARENDLIQGVARGSAGASLVSYYLKIIHIDPIKNKLPFERFLSHERLKSSFPDIDTDFSNRKKIVEYLKEKYNDGFAQISTFTKIKTKNAIKDAMRAIYGILSNNPDVETVCKTIPNSSQGIDEKDFLYGYTDENEVYHEGIYNTNETLQDFFKKYPKAKGMVDRLIGLTRGWGRHASAFVVSTDGLSDGIVPMMYMDDPNIGKMPVTQYSAPMIENCGLIKLDILVVKTLEALSECKKLVKERHNVDLTETDKNGIELIYRLPDDKKVYDDFARCDTDSSFQFNTNLIKSYLPEFKPQSKSDLAILTSICRPGALDAHIEVPNVDEAISATQYYMDVRNNKKDIYFLHDDLKNIIGETNGIFCIAKGTKILLKDCIKNIEDVKPGDMVKTEDGSYQRVLINHFNGIKPVRKITTHTGGSIKATDEHKFLTLNGWKKMKDLTWKYGKFNWIKVFWMKNGKTYKKGDKRDWIDGVIFFRGRIQGHVIVVDCPDEKFAKQFKNLVVKEYGLSNSHIKCFDGTNYKVIITENPIPSENIKDNILIERIENKYGLTEKPSTTSKRKMQYDNIVYNVKFMNFPENPTLAMVTGMAESSNLLYKNRIDRLTEEEAYEVYGLLQFFEIHSTLYTNNLTGKYKKTKPYIVAYKDIEEKMPFLFRRQETRIKEIYKKVSRVFPKDHNLWGILVRKSAKTEEMPVYDLTIENNHSYVANGMVVHNCYQEDVMKFLSKIAMYTTEEADKIRSAISKKKHDIIIHAFDRIKKATAARGWTPIQSQKICEQIEAFAKYSFNKSHACGYSLLGYITMYLKHHYFLEWWTSILNSRINHEDKIRAFIPLLRKKIKMPSLKHPYDKFTIVKNKIIAPINMVKGVGEKAVKNIIDNAPYKNLKDFATKIDKRIVNIGTICSLINGGVLDCFIKNENTEIGRKEILTEYINFLNNSGKSIKTDSKSVVSINEDKTSIKNFLDNKSKNIVFCKSILEDNELKKYIESKVPELRKKDDKSLPYFYKETGVALSVDIAEKLNSNGYGHPLTLFLIYKNFEIRNGVSKKTNKKWENTTIKATDGIHNVSLTIWEKKVFDWDVNTIIKVTGKVTKHIIFGYQISVDNVEEIK
jgi:DNA polymerase III subunit alpha